MSVQAENQRRPLQEFHIGESRHGIADVSGLADFAYRGLSAHASRTRMQEAHHSRRVFDRLRRGDVLVRHPFCYLPQIVVGIFSSVRLIGHLCVFEICDASRISTQKHHLPQGFVNAGIQHGVGRYGFQPFLQRPASCPAPGWQHVRVGEMHL